MRTLRSPDFHYKEYQKVSKHQAYFNRYFNYLFSLAVTRFEWINLPKEILPQALEKILISSSRAIFFKDDAIDMFAVMPVNEMGKIDIYGGFDMRQAYSYNYTEFYDKKDSVIIHDNITDYCLLDYIVMYADSLANMRLTRDINIYVQRTPAVFAGDSKAKLTMNNLFKQYDDFVPFIMTKKDMINGSLDLNYFKIDAPIVFDKIEAEMKKEKNDFLTMIGIDCSDDSKKERLVSDEVFSNNGECEMNRNNGLHLRKRACRILNEMFGLEVDVRFRSNIPITPDRGESSESGSNSPMEFEDWNIEEDE